jgi:hypothetical protein
MYIELLVVTPGSQPTGYSSQEAAKSGSNFAGAPTDATTNDRQQREAGHELWSYVGRR